MFELLEKARMLFTWSETLIDSKDLMGFMSFDGVRKISTQSR